MIIFKKKRIELGEGHIVQYTIFESKYLGGIWLYNWKTIDQNRFHSHAFSSIAVTLRGSYVQEVMMEDGSIIKEEIKSWLRPRFLPKNYVHRVLEASPNTWTFVIFGRWQKTWKEYFEDTKTWVTYAWGRKVVSKSKGWSSKRDTISKN